MIRIILIFIFTLNFAWGEDCLKPTVYYKKLPISDELRNLGRPYYTSPDLKWGIFVTSAYNSNKEICNEIIKIDFNNKKKEIIYHKCGENNPSSTTTREHITFHYKDHSFFFDIKTQTYVDVNHSKVGSSLPFVAGEDVYNVENNTVQSTTWKNNFAKYVFRKLDGSGQAVTYDKAAFIDGKSGFFGVRINNKTATLYDLSNQPWAEVEVANDYQLSPSNNRLIRWVETDDKKVYAEEVDLKTKSKKIIFKIKQTENADAHYLENEEILVRRSDKIQFFKNGVIKKELKPKLGVGQELRSDYSCSSNLKLICFEIDCQYKACPGKNEQNSGLLIYNLATGVSTQIKLPALASDYKVSSDGSKVFYTKVGAIPMSQGGYNMWYFNDSGVIDINSNQVTELGVRGDALSEDFSKILYQGNSGQEYAEIKYVCADPNKNLNLAATTKDFSCLIPEEISLSTESLKNLQYMQLMVLCNTEKYDEATWNLAASLPPEQPITAKKVALYLMRFQKPGGFIPERDLGLFLKLASTPGMIEAQPGLFGHALFAIVTQYPELYLKLLKEYPVLAKASTDKTAACQNAADREQLTKTFSWSSFAEKLQKYAFDGNNSVLAFRPFIGALKRQYPGKGFFNLLYNDFLANFNHEFKLQLTLKGNDPQVQSLKLFSEQQIKILAEQLATKIFLPESINNTEDPKSVSAIDFNTTNGPTLLKLSTEENNDLSATKIGPFVLTKVEFQEYKGLKNSEEILKKALNKKNSLDDIEKLFGKNSFTPLQLSRLKKIYQLEPWALTEQVLDAEDLTFQEVDYLLKLAQKPEALYAKKPNKPNEWMFKPTQAQAYKVIAIVLKENSTNALLNTEATYKSLLWLSGRAEIPIDQKFFEKFDLLNVRGDVEKMISEDPFKYKGSPALALLKIGKALLNEFTISEVTCSDGKNETSSKFSEIANWLANYADLADKVFVAKIFRAMFEKYGNQICPADAANLIRTIGRWGEVLADLRDDITKIALIMRDNRKMKDLKFEEAISLLSIIGPRAVLGTEKNYKGITIAAMRAYATINKKNRTAEDFALIIDQILGRSESKFQAATAKPINVAALAPQPGRLKKLCVEIAKYDQEAKGQVQEFFNDLAEKLDQKPRPQFSGLSPTSSESIREVLQKNPFSADDLMIAEKGCSAIANPSTTVEPKTNNVSSKPKATPNPAASLKKPTDFDPYKGIKKKKTK